jgi:hypothetical protein
MRNVCTIKNPMPSNEKRKGIGRFLGGVLKKHAAALSLSVPLVAGAAGCATLGGATLGGAIGAGVGAGTHSNVGRSAAIGAGVGGTTGALYDLYNYSRRDRYRDYNG